jgi:casein kinase 1
MKSGVPWLLGKTILKTYVVRRHLGGGTFGDVYLADDIVSQRVVAIKFETGSSTTELLNEFKMYQILDGMDGIPKMFAFHEYKKGHVLVMDHLGPSLDALFRRCGKLFSLKTVLMIADQIFRIIQWVHQCGVIHRDIKPHNFLVGRGELRNKIYLIDFGISAPYLDPRSHEHKDFTRNNGLIGTAQYVSVNTHLGDQQSRRDDVESIMYMLIRFLKGTLPWNGIKDCDRDARNEKITQVKLHTTPEALCSDLPNEFLVVLDHIRRLSYEMTPNYHWIRGVFQRLFVKSGFVYDSVFDWDEAAAIHKPVPSEYLLQCATQFQFSHERHVRERKSLVKLPNPRTMFISPWT